MAVPRMAVHRCGGIAGSRNLQGPLTGGPKCLLAGQTAATCGANFLL
jgi:hypothetical protein